MDKEMSPKQEKEPVAGSGGSSDEQDMDAESDDVVNDLVVNEDELDLDEIAALNENLDSLNAVMDIMEQRADDMKAKVMELLLANREITKALKEQKNAEGGDDSQCNHGPGQPADEA